MSYTEVEILRAACCIAALDNEVCEKEQAILEKLRDRLGVGRVSFQAMLDRARSDHNFYEEQFKIAQVDADHAIKTLTVLAMADHQITLNERVVLQHFAATLGMDQQRFDQIYAAAEKHLEKQSSGEADASGKE
ncbi:MAG: hypothetical protein ACODAQ_03400 [Phycisphaeraceae bacterium]